MLDDLNQKNHLRRFIREGASATTASARATSESWLTEIQKEGIANLQKMAVAERREAEPTTAHRNEVGLAVRQATIELLAESCRQ